MDQIFMSTALDLATKARGHTAPNPLVGAVVVSLKNEIIGRGFHPRAGEPHAEVFAINEALKTGESLAGATLYVTLEPCNHFGKTPPCVDLILSSGIKTVKVGVLDANPLMQGKSIEKLRVHGINVEVGILKNQAESLVRGFKSVLKTGFPFVTLKCATSLDGKIATQSGESQWITEEPARQLGHFERAHHDTILVGIGTVLSDDPRLSVRVNDTPEVGLRKVILDSQLRTPVNSKIFFSPGEVLIYCDLNYSSERKHELENAGAKIIPLTDLKEILKDLALRGSQEILVEGGAKVLGSFVREKLFDRIIYILAPKILGSEGRDVFDGLNVNRLIDSVVLKNVSTQMIGHDILIEGIR
jgi:diaminohydroxyphosphoribosylaminopyrimidine deaminase/5-amino-6-(5-phosphoribosylamino)uracil reductase